MMQIGLASDQYEYSFEEGLMRIGATGGIRRSFDLSLQDLNRVQNPPRILPDTQRVRVVSPSRFEGHRPRSLSRASDNHFQICQWIRFPSVRMVPEMMTFSTLPEELYTPTKKKPWQGIYIGDNPRYEYDPAPWCQFLVVLQVKADRGTRRITSSRKPEDDGIHDKIGEGPSPADGNNAHSVSLEENTEESEDEPYYGRLEAIKLTGDSRVPRGEYLWVAPDIGSKGLIRIGHEQLLKGTRIVRSLGHLAATPDFQDFRDYRRGKSFVRWRYSFSLTLTPADRYVPTELMMISHGHLGMYWEVSFVVSESPLVC